MPREEQQNIVNLFIESSDGVLGFEETPCFSSTYEALRNTCDVILIDLSVHSFAKSSFYSAGLSKHFVHLFHSYNADVDELYILETLLPNIISIPMEFKVDADIHFPVLH